jgi:transposase
VRSEDRTGEKCRQGTITKSGSRHARRLLVEAAWHYRCRELAGLCWTITNADEPPPVHRVG